MIGRGALLALVLAAYGGPARADEAPPPVPSSYESERAEALARKKAERAALVAKRRSRQVEYTGAGAAAGDTAPGTGISIDITARQLGGLSATALIGAAAVRALSEGTKPDLGNSFVDNGASAGAAAAGVAATATATGTN